MRFDPALLLQPVQCWIKRTLLNLEHLCRHLLDAFGDRPAMLWLERNSLEYQKIQGALDEITWLSYISDHLQYIRLL